ncbi:MAG: uroporphyrinogen-III C-methyltransferase [bacterium]
MPFVSFVGAGPGDPELITVKGLRRLREASVVIHDRLIPPELLAEARPPARVIDAGKAPGGAGRAQADINGLLVTLARRHGSVVRLKGGDPSLFGRLAEEIEAVRAAGVDFEVVPGITAATAASARAGISLTARGRSSLVVLATGSDQSGRSPLDLDWEGLARVDGTLVFYMAVRSLETITTKLTALGRDPGEPTLVVERAGMSGERLVIGRLGDIADAAREAEVTAPALLITGPTVSPALVSAPEVVPRLLAGVGV